MKPPNQGGSTRSRAWPHVDQGSKKLGVHCVQGWVTLEDIGEHDGALMVMEGSHKFHKEYLCEKFPEDVDRKEKITVDWVKLNEADHGDKTWFLKRGCKDTKVAAPKGSMVLWDSRLVHWNCPPDKQGTRWRMVIYVCMTPRSWATNAHLEKKRKAFRECRGTNHWPHEIKLFPAKPRTYGKELPDFNIQSTPPQLSDLGKRLAGL